MLKFKKNTNRSNIYIKILVQQKIELVSKLDYFYKIWNVQSSNSKDPFFVEKKMSEKII